MKLIIIDNYDSFTYNLIQIVEQSGCCDFDVVKNDETDLDKISLYDKILISPGPGLPEDAGIVPELIKRYSSSKSILGICLGHQAIAVVFGARLKNLQQIIHGQATPTNILDTQDYIFDGLPEVFEAGRYHSWVVDPQSLPGELKVTAEDSDGNIMAVSHNIFDVKGVQFHPESILTPRGRMILENWMQKPI